MACQLAITAPYPSNFKDHASYALILGAPLLRINMSGFAAFIIANLINSYIIARWKILLKGRYFWLRSLGSSAFSEALYSLIAILMMELYTIPTNYIFKLILISFLIKAAYSIILSAPANLVVNYIKKATGIDVYEFPHKFTPFKYLGFEKRQD